MNVYAIDLTKVQQVERDILFSFLPQSERLRLSGYLYKEDVERTLAGSIMLRIVINEKLGLKNKSIIIEHNNFGKPYLKGYNNFHFSISHSGSWVFCAVDDNAIGIDVEQIKPIDLNGIIKLCLTSQESKVLSSGNPYERLERFYELWTIKESFAKAIGTGLSLSPASIEIILGRPKTIRNNNRFSIESYNLGDYYVSICAICNNFPKYFTILTIDDLLRKSTTLI